jgi:tRNA pseudouridine38-40 synthase
MPRIALLIEYDGSRLAGWQVQENAQTVQSQIEDAFFQIYQERIAVAGAGRTDSGVHGRGMVAHADTPELSGITNFKLLAALNGTTPTDIVIHDIRNVPNDFHARHSAVSREYSYTVHLGRAALHRDCMWAVSFSLDTTLMQKVSNLLLGEHDFTSYSKRSDDVEHYRCTIDICEWKLSGTNFVLNIRANRFVRGMVRALVGAMVEIGKGTLSIAEFEHLLLTPTEHARARYTAPARGLVLEAVRYPSQYGLWGNVER